jgi:hypothetical protein
MEEFDKYGALNLIRAFFLVGLKFKAGCENKKQTNPTAIKLEKNGNNLIKR